jgi:hypothetical protein
VVAAWAWRWAQADGTIPRLSRPHRHPRPRRAVAHGRSHISPFPGTLRDAGGRPGRAVRGDGRHPPGTSDVLVSVIVRVGSRRRSLPPDLAPARTTIDASGCRSLLPNGDNGRAPDEVRWRSGAWDRVRRRRHPSSHQPSSAPVVEVVAGSRFCACGWRQSSHLPAVHEARPMPKIACPGCSRELDVPDGPERMEVEQALRADQHGGGRR